MDQNNGTQGGNQIAGADDARKHRTLQYLAANRIVRHTNMVHTDAGNIKGKINQLPLPRQTLDYIVSMVPSMSESNEVLRGRLVEMHGTDSKAVRAFDILCKPQEIPHADLGTLRTIMHDLGQDLRDQELNQIIITLLSGVILIDPIKLTKILNERGILHQLQIHSEVNLFYAKFALSHSTIESGVMSVNHGAVKRIIDTKGPGFHYVVDWINRSSELKIQCLDQEDSIPASIYFRENPGLISPKSIKAAIKVTSDGKAKSLLKAHCITDHPNKYREFFNLALKKPDLSPIDKERIRNTIRERQAITRL